MRGILKALIILLVSLLLLTNCLTSAPEITSTTTPASTKTKVLTSIPTETPLPEGETLIVESVDDSGIGSLHQALLEADPGDTIKFDAGIFTPENPTTIFMRNPLPDLVQGYLTIDASDAGVILDGSQISGEWTPAIQIQSSNNVIQGIQIQNFSGAGFVIGANANNNLVGGDREIGNAKFGQGNVIINCSDGVIVQGSQNVIKGNLIGTDGSDHTDGGNLFPGVALESKASDNIIGPNNTIAYNGKRDGAGIEIRSKLAVNNRITANMIFGNKHGSILYNDLALDMENATSSPLILEFDLEEGYVNGFACSGCVVEVFSTSGKEGEIFEYQTEADETGFFELYKEGGFKGPSLNANAFEKGKNTSPLCVSTKGEFKKLEIQVANKNSNPFQAKPSTELDENRLGQMASLKSDIHSASDADGFLLQNTSLGLKNVRITFDWFDYEEVDWGAEEYSKFIIDPNHELVIDKLIDAGIAIRYCLVFWDPESPGQTATAGYSRFEEQSEIQRYLDYAQFIASHFKGRIKYYEILNEPYSGGSTQQSVDVENYIELVRQVIPAIQQEDPDAKIVMGAIPNLYEPSDYDYLLDILNSDIIRQVDGISFHPMHGVSPDYQYRKFYYNYPSIIQEIKEIAGANGFTGEYFADELVWRTSINPLESEPWTYSKTVMAKYYARGIVANLGMDLRTNLALESLEELPQMVNTIKNISTIMAGAAPINIEMEIENDVELMANYAFSTQKGDQMIALWTDGVGLDDDPGVSSTVVIKNLQTDKVIGIDPLNSYQQELNFQIEDGSTVIDNLLIKDYPIFLVMENAASL